MTRMAHLAGYSQQDINEVIAIVDSEPGSGSQLRYGNSLHQQLAAGIDPTGAETEADRELRLYLEAMHKAQAADLSSDDTRSVSVPSSVQASSPEGEGKGKEKAVDSPPGVQRAEPTPISAGGFHRAFGTGVFPQTHLLGRGAMFAGHSTNVAPTSNLRSSFSSPRPGSSASNIAAAQAHRTAHPPPPEHTVPPASVQFGSNAHPPWQSDVVRTVVERGDQGEDSPTQSLLERLYSSVFSASSGAPSLPPLNFGTAPLLQEALATFPTQSANLPDTVPSQPIQTDASQQLNPTTVPGVQSSVPTAQWRTRGASAPQDSGSTGEPIPSNQSVVSSSSSVAEAAIILSNVRKNEEAKTVNLPDTPSDLSLGSGNEADRSASASVMEAIDTADSGEPTATTHTPSPDSQDHGGPWTRVDRSRTRSRGRGHGRRWGRGNR
ncbi:hypothetical protein FN846DRAFT_890039 [Sphaerosporella brunnea]|uniref:Uncharacterized protein n=1 Tax=Sphaerosporella brunnea TaxID=1250544 RepID=A0A5J5EY47_9PEZI|nr:hypothetical protein FN846DRAFT_890039 [Sphaerosporella brunnea]